MKYVFVLLLVGAVVWLAADCYSLRKELDDARAQLSKAEERAREAERAVVKKAPPKSWREQQMEARRDPLSPRG